MKTNRADRRASLSRRLNFRAVLTRRPATARKLLATVFLASALPTALAQNAGAFSCANGATKTAQSLTAATRFDDSSGKAFGWDPQASPTSFNGGSCSSAKPFLFSIAEGDGNYQVAVELGGVERSAITVKAEARRLMVFQAAIPAGGSKTFVFNVNVRTQDISGGQKVRLKEREIGALDWDNRLTLEFNGDHPSVRSIAIKPIDVPTVYLAGDSTVVDQDKEPWAAWGQMLPVFFDQNIAIANHAESGETIKGFLGERRFDKIFSRFKKGDFLFLQFAHNDQKPGSGFSSIDEYKKEVRALEAQVKAKGGALVLVSSMNRRAFDESGKIKPTLGDYPQAMRDVAAEDHVALVDLNAMSKTLYEAMGPEGTIKAFVHYPANTFPDQPKELKDDTHFNAYGAYELARCVVQSLRDQDSPLAKYLVPNIPAFDPAHPDPVDGFHMPSSPFYSTLKPYGN